MRRFFGLGLILLGFASLGWATLGFQRDQVAFIDPTYQATWWFIAILGLASTGFGTWLIWKKRGS